MYVCVHGCVCVDGVLVGRVDGILALQACLIALRRFTTTEIEIVPVYVGVGQTVLPPASVYHVRPVNHALAERLSTVT